MDIGSALLGLAGGGLGTSLLTWLTGRRKAADAEQMTVADVATRYWARVVALEASVATLSGELIKRDLIIAGLQTKLAQLERQVNVRDGNG